MDTNKYNIFLDLDATVLSTVSASDFDDREAFEEKMKKFSMTPKLDKKRWMVARPGLQYFLDYLFHNFNVGVFTAASYEYGLFAIDNLITPPGSNRELGLYLWDKHSFAVKGKGVQKDLKTVLGSVPEIRNFFTEENTRIIDDNPDVKDTNPTQSIVAEPFDFGESGSYNDDFLEYLVKMFEYGSWDPRDFVDNQPSKINLSLGRSGF